MDLDASVSFLARKLPNTPSVFIIYTNALGNFPPILTETIELNCNKIPHFPLSRNGFPVIKLKFGKIDNTYVLIQTGHYHHHEGFSSGEIAFPVRIAHALGCRKMFITNAAGSISENLKLGDLMLIRSHLNLNKPFCESDPSKIFKKKRKETRKFYDEYFTLQARKLALEENMEEILKKGIYAMIGNDAITPEINILKTLGVDAIGVSSLPEILTANELGMQVSAISVITDIEILDREKHPEAEAMPEEIWKALEPKKGLIEKLIKKFINE